MRHAKNWGLGSKIGTKMTGGRINDDENLGVWISWWWRTLPRDPKLGERWAMAQKESGEYWRTIGKGGIAILQRMLWKNKIKNKNKSIYALFLFFGYDNLLNG